MAENDETKKPSKQAAPDSTIVPAAAQAPSRNATQDDRTKELLRLVNGGERQLVGALEQLALAANGSGSGAFEIFDAVKCAVKDGAQAVRNAAMNHAIFIEDNPA